MGSLCVGAGSLVLGLGDRLRAGAREWLACLEAEAEIQLGGLEFWKQAGRGPGGTQSGWEQCESRGAPSSSPRGAPSGTVPWEAWGQWSTGACRCWGC